jgi:hypothetical protein
MIDNFILLMIGLFLFSVMAVIGECLWGDK